MYHCQLRVAGSSLARMPCANQRRHFSMPLGRDLLLDPMLNKGTAFTERERDVMRLRGLLPPRVCSIDEQLRRQQKGFQNAPTDLAKYNYLERLHRTNETLYYRFLLERISDTMPIVYTPTVGQACLDFSELYHTRSSGLFFDKNQRGHFREMCRNWPQREVDIIVMTDGSRILGLGDLGANGMGIPIGKLALYVAGAGFHPRKTLPVMIDLGTNNASIRENEVYLGNRSDRPNDEEFYEIMDDVIRALHWRYPKALIQFEDFSTDHAYGLLDRYHDKVLSFNDDIQGTAATALGGLLCALRLQNNDASKPPGRLCDQQCLFVGAGSASTGVADLIALGMHLESKAAGEEKSKDYFRKNNIWLMDSAGLVTASRGNELQAHLINFAREDATITNLLDAVKQVKPTVIFGLAGQPAGLFTKEIIETHTSQMLAENKRPLIFALSNPTSKSECTAEEAYKYSKGTAVFCSGSPFGPVTLNGKTFETGQGNNMYIFPGVGYAAVMCGAKSVNQEMFFAAATRLASMVTNEELARGLVFPNVQRIREISAAVADGTCLSAAECGLARRAEPKEGWLAYIRKSMWWPEYEQYA